MATRRRSEPPEGKLTIKLPPPIDEEGWKRLESMPGVIVHRRSPHWRGWTFKTDLHMQPGYDIASLIDQDEDCAALQYAVDDE